MNVLLQQIGLDKKNYLASFDDIAFVDPTIQNGRARTDKLINAMNINKNVYPDRLMDGAKPPKCVFVPDKQLMRKIIKL